MASRTARLLIGGRRHGSPDSRDASVVSTVVRYYYCPLVVVMISAL